jgi:hypothetical protein
MLWNALWLALAVLGAFGFLAWRNGRRFDQRVAAEARQIWASSNSPPPERTPAVELPSPVRRHAARAIGARTLAVRTVRLRHGGIFRTRLDGHWVPIRGTQYFTADPPAFVWWGRIGLGPGLWVDAVDHSIAGAGRMHVMLESSLTLADKSGPELDQGALLRLLGEMVWFPSALLDARYVTWSAIDDHHARAVLRVGGREVSAVFEYGVDSLPVSIHADRFRDDGSRPVSTPWTGEFSDYAEVEGFLVPRRVVSYWHIEGRRIPVLQFEVDRIEFDVTEPF